jgi:hypothetical protein
LVKKQNDTGRRILFSAQKNEGPFLLEWIAYHKVVGFTDIIIFSNDCDDGSDELLDALSDAGEIQHYRHKVPENVAPQLNAASIAQSSDIFRYGDWIMWLDIDEYLYIKSGGHKLDDLFHLLGDADAVAFSWRIFGDSGNNTWPGKQISDSFTKASRKGFHFNLNIKTLFKYTAAIRAMYLHRPILQKDIRSYNQYKFVHGGNQPVPNKFYSVMYPDGSPFHAIDTKTLRYKLGQVNHYAVRTPDMFSKKINRGRGYAAENSINTRHNETYYAKYNQNLVEDRKILQLSVPLDKEFSRLKTLISPKLYKKY